MFTNSCSAFRQIGGGQRASLYFLLNCLQLKITLMPKWHISGAGEYRYRHSRGLTPPAQSRCSEKVTMSLWSVDKVKVKVMVRAPSLMDMRIRLLFRF